MFVFQLNKALSYNGEWHGTGGSNGTLYKKLERAQAQVVGAGEWKRDDRARRWRTAHNDLITQRKVVD